MAFINRELSWIEFNQRVLDEARRPELPLLERLKFLAITASNLDEFFQVRVGGLTMVRRSGSRSTDIAGLTASQQITLIRRRVVEFTATQYDLLNDELLPALRKAGIRILPMRELSPNQKVQVAAYFTEMAFPLLTPLAIAPDSPEPVLPPLQLLIACRLEDLDDEISRHVIVPVPENLPRFIPIQSGNGDSFVLIEDLIQSYLEDLFPGESVGASAPIRITRNSDIAVQEEDSIDLAGDMEDVIAARRFGDTVRVEVSAGTPRDLLRLVQEVTASGPSELYRVSGPLGLSDFMELVSLRGYRRLRYPDWPPQASPLVDPNTSIFDLVKQRDILLHHPFESFEPVLRLLEEAAADPQVLAIKQALYRTADESRVIQALIRAAESGKQVTALVELKARFDEARNLERAERLQRSGVRVVYGVRNLKTHAKVTLVARLEDGRLRRYVHLGTGNYNEATAQLYTDISYLTARPEYGSDASLFFNAVSGRSKLVRLRKISPAPNHMKGRILELIAGESGRASRGEPARILAKMNSLQDPDIIDALYKASRSGVEINLNIRGICCLQTGTRKSARNIRVVSIIDRFLEHSRIFYFHQGGEPVVYISSADWMTRNLEKRVELLIPIEDSLSRRRLIRILEAAFRDNTHAHEILENGTSHRIPTPKGQKRFRFQEALYRQAVKASKARQHERATTFQPHRPPQ